MRSGTGWNKRRLGAYIGTLPEKHIRGIDRALAISVGLHDQRDKPLELCLCNTCAQHFLNTGKSVLRRKDPTEVIRDTCTYCGQRLGHDYYVTHRGTEAGHGSK